MHRYELLYLKIEHMPLRCCTSEDMNSSCRKLLRTRRMTIYTLLHSQSASSQKIHGLIHKLTCVFICVGSFCCTSHRTSDSLLHGRSECGAHLSRRGEAVCAGSYAVSITGGQVEAAVHNTARYRIPNPAQLHGCRILHRVPGEIQGYKRCVPLLCN